MNVLSNINNGKVSGLNKFRIFAVLCIIFTFFLAAANTGMHTSFMWAYGTPIVFAAIGCTFYTKEYFKKKRYVVFMMFGVWFVVCRWLCGNFTMMLTDQLATSMMCYALLVALPFACVMDDADRRSYLDVICWVTVIGYAFLYILMYWGHFRGEPVVLIKDRFVLGSKMLHGVLFMMMGYTDDYPTDYIASLCLLLSLYLAFSSWKKHKGLSFIALILAAVFSLTVILVPCRTVLMGVCGAVLMILLIFLQKLRIPKIWIWITFGVCCAAGAAFLLFGTDQMYATVTGSTRSVIGRLKNFSGRMWTWDAAFKILRDEPIAWFHGFAMDDVMGKILKYDSQGLGHMHNGFLEVLMLMGIPGVLAMLAFSVKLIISSVKVFFSQSELVATASKMLVVIVAVFFFMNIFDSLVFINRTNTDAVNFFFALFCGYIFELEDKLKEQRS